MLYDHLLLGSSHIGTEVLQLFARLWKDVSGDDRVTVFHQVFGHGTAHVTEPDEPHWCLRGHGSC